MSRQHENCNAKLNLPTDPESHHIIHQNVITITWDFFFFFVKNIVQPLHIQFYGWVQFWISHLQIGPLIQTDKSFPFLVSLSCSCNSYNSWPLSLWISPPLVLSPLSSSYLARYKLIPCVFAAAVQGTNLLPVCVCVCVRVHVCVWVCVSVCELI